MTFLLVPSFPYSISAPENETSLNPSLASIPDALSLSRQTKTSNASEESFYQYLQVLKPLGNIPMTSYYINPFSPNVMIINENCYGEMGITMWNFLVFLQNKIVLFSTTSSEDLRNIKLCVDDMNALIENLKFISKSITHQFFTFNLINFIESYVKYINSLLLFSAARNKRKPQQIIRSALSCANLISECCSLLRKLDSNTRMYFEKTFSVLSKYYRALAYYEAGKEKIEKMEFGIGVSFLREACRISGKEEAATCPDENVVRTMTEFIGTLTTFSNKAEDENKRIYSVFVPADPPALPNPYSVPDVTPTAGLLFFVEETLADQLISIPGAPEPNRYSIPKTQPTCNTPPASQPSNIPHQPARQSSQQPPEFLPTNQQQQKTPSSMPGFPQQGYGQYGGAPYGAQPQYAQQYNQYGNNNQNPQYNQQYPQQQMQQQYGQYQPYNQYQQQQQYPSPTQYGNYNNQYQSGNQYGQPNMQQQYPSPPHSQQQYQPQYNPQVNTQYQPPQFGYNYQPNAQPTQYNQGPPQFSPGKPGKHSIPPNSGHQQSQFSNSGPPSFTPPSSNGGIQNTNESKPPQFTPGTSGPPSFSGPPQFTPSTTPSSGPPQFSPDAPSPSNQAGPPQFTPTTVQPSNPSGPPKFTPTTASPSAGGPPQFTPATVQPSNPSGPPKFTPTTASPSAGGPPQFTPATVQPSNPSGPPKFTPSTAAPSAGPPQFTPTNSFGGPPAFTPTSGPPSYTPPDTHVSGPPSFGGPPGNKPGTPSNIPSSNPVNNPPNLVNNGIGSSGGFSGPPTYTPTSEMSDSQLFPSIDALNNIRQAVCIKIVDMSSSPNKEVMNAIAEYTKQMQEAAESDNMITGFIEQFRSPGHGGLDRECIEESIQGAIQFYTMLDQQLNELK